MLLALAARRLSCEAPANAHSSRVRDECAFAGASQESRRAASASSIGKKKCDCIVSDRSPARGGRLGDTRGNRESRSPGGQRFATDRSPALDAGDPTSREAAFPPQSFLFGAVTPLYAVWHVCLGIIAASWLTGRPREAGDSAHEGQTSLVRREGIAASRRTDRPRGAGGRLGDATRSSPFFVLATVVASLRFARVSPPASARVTGSASLSFSHCSPASQPARFTFALPLRRLHGFCSCSFWLASARRLRGRLAWLLLCLCVGFTAFTHAFLLASPCRLRSRLACLLLLGLPYGLLTRFLAWLALRLAYSFACSARLTACLLVGLLGSPFGLLACLPA